jgi:anti-sigma-K factor RskA
VPENDDKNKAALKKPERKDVKITIEPIKIKASAIDPEASIQVRVDEIARVMQLLVQHVNEDREALAEDRKWRWILLALAIIAILVGISIPVFISILFH